MVGQGFGVNAERRKVKGVQIKSFQGTNAGEGGVGLAVHVALAQIDPRTVDGGPLYQSSKGKNVYKKKKTTTKQSPYQWYTIHQIIPGFYESCCTIPTKEGIGCSTLCRWDLSTRILVFPSPSGRRT